LPPQQYATPPDEIAHVWFVKGLMLVKLSPPMTVTADRLVFVVPSPSCPEAFQPQQDATPPGVIAQECRYPGNTVSKPAPLATATGTLLQGFVPWHSSGPTAPFPSWPKLFEPQQYQAPPVARPHVRNNPARSAVKVSPPATATGVRLHGLELHVSVAALAPIPSSPNELSPQQYAAPAAVRPQACRFAAPTVENWSPPATLSGVSLH